MNKLVAIGVLAVVGLLSFAAYKMPSYEQYKAGAYGEYVPCKASRLECFWTAKYKSVVESK